MDPNATLTRIREIVRMVADGKVPDGEANSLFIELVELNDALDEWLKIGGFLPNVWANELRW